VDTSSELYYTMGDWCDETGYPWVCHMRLSPLFKLGRVDARTRIQFYACETSSTDTYECVIGKLAVVLISPVRSSLWSALYRWLDRQIAAGRPHIGVYVWRVEKKGK
jgi:hypothetical protein